MSSNYRVISADSDQKISFYTFDGQFKFHVDNFYAVSADLPQPRPYTEEDANKKEHLMFFQQELQGGYKGRRTNNISLYTKTFDTSAYPDYPMLIGGRKIFFSLNELNHIVNRVDQLLVNNEEYNVYKLKTIMSIPFTCNYYVSGRVHIYNKELVCYYDGTSWNKLPTLF